MPSQKRSLENESTKNGSKKLKIADSKHEKHTPSSGATLPAEELDFPRGGGTSFTPLEVKAIRAEAVKEANVEIFEVRISFFIRKYFNFGLIGFPCCEKVQKAKTRLQWSRPSRW